MKASQIKNLHNLVINFYVYKKTQMCKEKNNSMNQNIKVHIKCLKEDWAYNIIRSLLISSCCMLTLSSFNKFQWLNTGY
jgi:hypothetical protein